MLHRPYKHEFREERVASNNGQSYFVTLDTITHFDLKNVVETHLAVPRILEFHLRHTTLDGEGTDVLQIFKLRVWWDKSTLVRKLADTSK